MNINCPSRLNKDLFVISPELLEALHAHRPIVNFESSILTHGLNPDDAAHLIPRVTRALEENQAVNSQVLIKDGQIRIGLSDNEKMDLAETAARPNRGGIVKCNMWNIADALRRKITASPTIAAASFLASQCHPRFAQFHSTGGLGAIPRDYFQTMDMSNDQKWMASYSFLIVSSYDKGFFGLSFQKEYCETMGIPLVAYGQYNLPAFWMKDSGIKAPIRVDTPQEAAQLFKLHVQLGLNTAVAICAPPPAGSEIPNELLEPLVHQILKEASDQKIQGMDYTPFVLGKFAEYTKGWDFSTVRTNLDLFENNARICGKIAKAFNEIDSEPGDNAPNPIT